MRTANGAGASVINRGVEEFDIVREELDAVTDADASGAAHLSTVGTRWPR